MPNTAKNGYLFLCHLIQEGSTKFLQKINFKTVHKDQLAAHKGHTYYRDIKTRHTFIASTQCSQCFELQHLVQLVFRTTAHSAVSVSNYGTQCSQCFEIQHLVQLVFRTYRRYTQLVPNTTQTEQHCLLLSDLSKVYQRVFPALSLDIYQIQYLSLTSIYQYRFYQCFVQSGLSFMGKKTRFKVFNKSIIISVNTLNSFTDFFCCVIGLCHQGANINKIVYPFKITTHNTNM